MMGSVSCITAAFIRITVYEKAKSKDLCIINKYAEVTFYPYNTNK